MHGKKCFARISALAFLSVVIAGQAYAQASSNHKEAMKRIVEASNKLSDNQKAFLSSGLRHVLQHARKASSDDLDLVTEDNYATTEPLLDGQATVRAAATVTGTVMVSNPSLDFAKSSVGGFTQSTTSSARCGSSVVVGYEDTGAQLRSHPLFQNFDGVSASTDGGLTFTDLGFLNPGTDPNAILGGNPAVACSSSTRFYYGSLYETTLFDNGNCLPGCPLSGISVSTSTASGKAWANPVTAVLLDGYAHALDMPSLAVDPTNPLQLYLTFTDFDLLGGCTSIDIVNSKDGGKTWSAPLAADAECYPPGNTVTGSTVVISPSGKVHVAYEVIPPALNAVRQIFYRRSLDHGQTFSAALKISDVVPIGDGSVNNIMQANLQAREFPQIAVDRTNGPSRGYLYIAWADGRNHLKPDSLSGTYAYADIFIAKSIDIGLSFSVLPPISPAPAGFTGRGRDQFAPGVAVDKNGQVAVCYYDRRNDPRNMAIDRYCSVSLNHGSTWQNLRASTPSWVPLAGDVLQEQPGFLVAIPFLGIPGDFDSLTTDFLLVNPGFFGAFQIQTDGNPNVVGRQF